MTDDINIFELACVIDSTGSMGHLISVSQQQMTSLISKLALKTHIQMRVGLTEFKDHPPEDRLLARTTALTSDMNEVQHAIKKIKADGGGDTPEAVYDGILSAAKELKWHPHSRRVLVLLGDAPPHGVGAPGDHFAKGCPCGETIQSTTAELEDRRITLYSIGLTQDKYAQDAFKGLATLTGGQFFQSNVSGAMGVIETVLEKEFGHIEFDKQVLEAWHNSKDTDAVVKAIGSNRIDVGASLSRLGSRGFLS